MLQVGMVVVDMVVDEIFDSSDRVVVDMVVDEIFDISDRTGRIERRVEQLEKVRCHKGGWNRAGPEGIKINPTQ
jgi:hypothetical protein